MGDTRLRELCGVRSGDKGDISDITLFADRRDVYEHLVAVATADRVKDHFGALVTGDVRRYEVPNLLALKFVLDGALGGGVGRSLRSDSQGKTHGLTLLRMTVPDPPGGLPDEWRTRRRPPGLPSGS